MRCPEITVQYDDTVTDLYQDIPVTYMIDKTLYKGFIDASSRKLKEKSYKLLPNEILTTMHRMDNEQWSCHNEGKRNFCNPPKQLSVDNSPITNAIKMDPDIIIGGQLHTNGLTSNLAAISGADADIKNSMKATICIEKQI